MNASLIIYLVLGVISFYLYWIGANTADMVFTAMFFILARLEMLSIQIRKKMSKEGELNKALKITLADGELPTNEQLKNASVKWMEAVDSPFRLQADKDFLAGAIWGVKLMAKLKM